MRRVDKFMKENADESMLEKLVTLPVLAGRIKSCRFLSGLVVLCCVKGGDGCKVRLGAYAELRVASVFVFVILCL